ncbi:uncharacterized protein CEXT_780531 [Caerostris extrusa]|uniref:Uncharacterized protein n=1 Tax=Caerostris extrusa TaxID=172846 RepID=A0AAV4XI14_CAEEX|nr:uncharacterized protein CEXT_780531 [Caerostris extrusa]
MALLPPKLRNLPPELLREESEMEIVPQSVWKIDVPSENNFLWAITLSYFTESLKIKKFQESLQNIASYIGISSKDVTKYISHMKKITKKFNPFINYYSIYLDRFMLRFVRLLETFLARKQMPNHPGNISNNNDFINKAAKFLRCAIHVCKTDGDENIDLYSSYPEENNLGNKCLRLILFQQVNKTEDDSKFINETNRSIYTEAISSLFLNILSNLFFPKCNARRRNCKLGNESCLQKHNSRRFIPFHYRTCFLKCAAALKNELRNSTDHIQSSSKPLLKELTKGLILLPEVEDVFIIIRLMCHLKIVEDLSPGVSGAKRILTIDRTFQIIGEILQNKTVSNTVTRSLLKCVLPPELVSRFIMIRDHSLGHHRASSVQGRVEMERDDDNFSYGIQKRTETNFYLT